MGSQLEITELAVEKMRATQERINRIVREASNDEIRDIVRNTELPEHHFAYIIDALVEHKAILKGHFELSSGGHSSSFFQFARIAGHPIHFGRICKCLAHLLWDTSLDIVLSPITPGGIYGQGVGRELSANLACAKVVEGAPAVFHQGIRLTKGKKVLIVNDISTTGKGILSLKALVDESLAEIAGIGLFACRHPAGLEGFKKVLLEEGNIPPEKVHALVEMRMDYYEDISSCPLCAQDKEFVEARYLI